MKNNMDALEIAKNFIRVNVERGDTIEDLMNSQMGGGCKEYHCDINPNLIINGKRVKRDSLVVVRVGNDEVNKVFSLTEVFNLIKSNQLTLF